MINQFSRMELLVGKEGIKNLNNSKIAVFGIGGVGSYVIEALARAGIGSFVLIDKDIIDVSNINRQLIATTKNLGQAKVDVAKQRILEINPNANIDIYKDFFMPESKDYFNSSFDYVIDAIDTVTAKIEIIIRAKKLNVPVISCMGTGNKLDPTRFEVDDIYKTSICPLARVMRKELRERGIKDLKVVYSQEKPIKVDGDNPGSISFVPSVAGLVLAGEVIKDLINKKDI